MHSLELVRRANELTTYIANRSVQHIQAEHEEHGTGYCDHDGAEIAIDHIEDSITYLFAEANNPTLPCLSRLATKAKEQGFKVQYSLAA